MYRHLRSSPAHFLGRDISRQHLSLRYILPAMVVLAAICFPLIQQSAYWQLLVAQAGIYIFVAIGLNVLTGYAGQVSIAQGALMGIGAYATGILSVTYHWSFWPSALVAVAATALIGAVMTLPALRLSAWYFAVITLIFAEVVQQLLVQMVWLTNGATGLVGVPSPTLGSHALTGRDFYWLIVVLDVALFTMVGAIVRSRLGRAFVALRDNELAASASGISIAWSKFAVFVFSAAIAGFGGALFAAQSVVITPDNFTIDLSIFLLVAVILGGSGHLWGPVIGGLVFFAGPEVLSGLSSWRTLVYGAVLLVLILVAPEGIAGALKNIWPRRRHLTSPAPSDSWRLDRVDGLRVNIRDLRKEFGGVVALQGVDLEVASNTVHAVVGPNGSGKTTLLNLISGFYRASRGSIEFDGQRVRHPSVASLARIGIGRTFQTPKLLPGLSVVENVMLGGHASEHWSAAEIALALPRARKGENASREHAIRLLGAVGLEELAERTAGDLTHGQQRLLEIARAMMIQPRLLLLDEPAAGLSLSELDSLATLIREIRDRGVTILIVEHHLDLVGGISDSVTVLDRGHVLTSGAPTAVFENHEVQAAYMGKAR